MLFITVKIMLFTIENNYNYFSRPIYCKPFYFAIFRIYFSINSMKDQGPLYEGWWANFGPQATGWEPLIYSNFSHVKQFVMLRRTNATLCIKTFIVRNECGASATHGEA